MSPGSWCTFFVGFGLKVYLIPSGTARWLESTGYFSLSGDKVEQLDFWANPHDAQRFVQKLMSNPEQCRNLWALAASGLDLVAGNRDLSTSDDYIVATIITEALTRGQLLVFRAEQRPYLPPPVHEPQAEPGPNYAPPTRYFELTVVFEHDGSGLGHVLLHVAGPDGSVYNALTNAQGRIRLNGILPGAYDVSAEMTGAQLASSVVACGWGKPEHAREPTAEEREAVRGARHLLHIEEHRVRTGETLEGIASDAGLSMQALATYNWNTTIPSNIQKLLRALVGCRHRNSKGEYVLHDGDRPGIIFLPRQWLARGLATGQQHVLRVRSVESPLELHFSS